MKLAKSKRRARMNPVTLNNLLTVSLIGPSLENFDPKDSIEQFMVRGILFILNSWLSMALYPFSKFPIAMEM